MGYLYNSHYIPLWGICQYCFFIKNRYKPSSIPLPLPHVSESTAILGKNRIIQLVITVYTNIFSHDKKNIYRLFSPPFLIENHTKKDSESHRFSESFFIILQMLLLFCRCLLHRAHIYEAVLMPVRIHRIRH